MKIAFVGKGGSGKSSVSWLAIQLLATAGQRVLAIDADHNMDLAHVLGVGVDDVFPTLHRAHDRFRMEVNQLEDRQWHNIVLDGRPLPTFSIDPKDTFTKTVTHQVSSHINLMVVGLGAEDVLFSSRCAHGHSAPLKYYLPLLELTNEQACIIDGVAGVDMMNFGLFTGADAVVVVVEPHQNSVRVYREVARIAERSELPVFAIINKSRPGEIRDHLIDELGERLLAELPVDAGILEYNVAKVDTNTKHQLQHALSSVRQFATPQSGLERLRAFESAKQAVKTTA